MRPPCLSIEATGTPGCVRAKQNLSYNRTGRVARVSSGALAMTVAQNASPWPSPGGQRGYSFSPRPIDWPEYAWLERLIGEPGMKALRLGLGGLQELPESWSVMFMTP